MAMLSRLDPARRRRALKTLRVAYVLTLAGVLCWALVSNWEVLATLLRGTRLLFLVAALVLSLGQIVLSAAFWKAALRALGETITLKSTVMATAASLPARYLPGSVWYALGRAAVLQRQGVSKRALGVAAMLETALIPVVGLGLGGLLLLAGGRLPRTGWSLALWMVALAVGTSPPAVNFVLDRIAARRGGPPARLTWPVHVRLLALNGAFWAWSATTFTVYLHAFPELELGAVATVAGAYMVAWGVGFLALFAPQGIGVFEVALAALVTADSLIGMALIVGGFRALMAVRDGLVFGATYGFAPMRSRLAAVRQREVDRAET